IAQTLSVKPSLSDRRQRGLLWRESIARMAVEAQPAAALRQGGVAGSNGGAGLGGAAANGGSSSSASRAFGFVGGGNGGASAGAGTGHSGRGGFGVLAALLGHTVGSEDPSAAMSSGSSQRWGGEALCETAACRDALAHVALASQLSTSAGPLEETRPKVLICQSEVSRMFGLQPLTTSACRLALDIYHRDLPAEERALALCQLATDAASSSVKRARPMLRKVAQELPHAGHLWAHVVGPRLINILLQAGETAAVDALLFQAAGALRAVPHGAAAAATQRLRGAANGVRLYHRQLLAAHRSAREAVETGAQMGTPGDICGHLLCLADIHLEARDPVAALGPLMRCLSAAESARLLHYRAEALVRVARVKLEMRDLLGALQLVEVAQVTPQLGPSGSARLRGDALLVQADVLFTLLASNQKDQLACKRLLKEILEVLLAASEQFEAVAELNSLRRCHYLLARTFHQTGNTQCRDQHARSFRKLS
ncbi:unnamed protein product, partial [Polarella glacialis]